MEENRPSKRIKTTDAMSTSRPYGFVSESLLYSNMGLSSEAIAFLGSPRVSSTLRIRAGMISNACYITSGDTIREFRRFIALKASDGDSDGVKLNPTPISKLLHHPFQVREVMTAHYIPWTSAHNLIADRRDTLDKNIY